MTESNSAKYVFVDGRHLAGSVASILEYVYGKECSSSVDYSRLRLTEKADRVFYYDGLPDRRSHSQNDEQFATARSAAESRIEKISRTPFVHTRTGAVVGDGGKRRQKEVDIMLAVEALTHAFRGNMRHAVVVTGDRDFRPLLRALVDAGTYVTLVSYNPPPKLLEAADVFIPLEVTRARSYTGLLIFGKKIEQLTTAMFHQSEWFRLPGSGECGERTVRLSRTRSGLWGITSEDPDDLLNVLRGTDEEKVIGYSSPNREHATRAFEVLYGGRQRLEVKWDDEATDAIRRQKGLPNNGSPD